MFLDYILKCSSIIIIPSRKCNIHFPPLHFIPKLQGKIVQWNATIYWSAQTKSWRRAYRLGNVYSINCLKLTWTRRNWEASVSRRAPRLIQISLIEITEEWILVNLENLPISWLMYMLLTEYVQVGEEVCLHLRVKFVWQVSEEDFFPCSDNNCSELLKAQA